MNFGSWLVLIGIGLAIQPFVLLYALLTDLGSVYYSKSTWDAIADSDIIASATGYKIMLTFEIFFNVALFTFSVFVAVLFFRKRDSFPHFYKIFVAGNLFFLIADTAVAYALFGDSVSNVYDTGLQDIVRKTLNAAIMIPYLQKSSRVRNTFVNTYGENLVLESDYDSQTVDNVDSEPV